MNVVKRDTFLNSVTVCVQGCMEMQVDGFFFFSRAGVSSSSQRGLVLGIQSPPRFSCTLLHLTPRAGEEWGVFFNGGPHCFSTCQQLAESLPSEAEESQKRSRRGRLAAGICGAVSPQPVHAGLACCCEPPPWHEQALTAVRSVLLPDRRRWGFEDRVISHGLLFLSSPRWRFESPIRSSGREKYLQLLTELSTIRGCQVHYGK